MVPVLLDFAEANKATGMTVESAFDLMGRALNGHTAMLGRYGIELDTTRLAAEGVSYLVEKLGEDYGGTAEALADLRTQNKEAWGDIQEDVGNMLDTILTPLLEKIKSLMEAYEKLTPVMKGFVTGVVVAIPIIATLATTITALTAAYHALHLAINPVVGILSLVAGAATIAGFSIAAASMEADRFAAAQTKMGKEIKDVQAQISIETEKFNYLATRLLELRSATNLTAEDKLDMKNIVRSMNDQYGEYLDNINLETIGYNQLKTAIDQANDALLSKMTTQAYEGLLSGQVQKLAEAKVALSQKMNEVLSVEVPSTQDNFMNIAAEQLKMLEARFSDPGKNPSYIAIKSLYDQAKLEHEGLRSATNEYNAAVGNLKQMKGGGGDSSVADAAAAEAKRNEEQRRLEQLRLLQQRYDTLSIDDAVARRQKELEIQRDNELAKAEALGSAEELLQSIRDHYAAESIKVEQDATAARTKQIEVEAEAKRKVLEEEKRLQEELEDMRFNFDQRGLELAGQTWDAQLLAIDNYYEKKRAKLLEAGLTEEQITAQSENAKAKIREQHEMRQLQGAQRIMGDLAKTSQAFGKKGFALWKTLAVGQAMIDTYASATGAYKAMVGIPIVGPGLAVAAAAAAVAAGLANVATIQAQEPPKAATGGLLVGRSHSQGGVLIEAEGDEYVTAKDRVKALGRGLFDFLNFAPLDSVKLAFAGMPAPSVPMPQISGGFYASGGSVSGGGVMDTLLDIMTSMRDEIISLKSTVVDSKPIIDIHVDPLSNDPVKISEIAEAGTRIRSTI